MFCCVIPAPLVQFVICFIAFIGMFNMLGSSNIFDVAILGV